MNDGEDDAPLPPCILAPPAPTYDSDNEDDAALPPYIPIGAKRQAGPLARADADHTPDSDTHASDGAAARDRDDDDDDDDDDDVPFLAYGQTCGAAAERAYMRRVRSVMTGASGRPEAMASAAASIGGRSDGFRRLINAAQRRTTATPRVAPPRQRTSRARAPTRAKRKRGGGGSVDTQPVSAGVPPTPAPALESHALGLATARSRAVPLTRRATARALGQSTALACMTLRANAEAHIKRLETASAAAADDKVRHLLEASAILVHQAVDRAERERRIWIHQTMTGAPMWSVATGPGANSRLSVIESVPAVVKDRTVTPGALFMPSTGPTQRTPGPLMYQ